MSISLKKLTKIRLGSQIKPCTYKGKTYDPELGNHQKIMDTLAYKSDMLKKRIRRNSGKLNQ